MGSYMYISISIPTEGNALLVSTSFWLLGFDYILIYLYHWPELLFCFFIFPVTSSSILLYGECQSVLHFTYCSPACTLSFVCLFMENTGHFLKFWSSSFRAEIRRVSGMISNQGFGDFDRLQHRSPSPMASSNLMSNVSGTGLGGWKGLPQEVSGTLNFKVAFQVLFPFLHLSFCFSSRVV